MFIILLKIVAGKLSKLASRLVPKNKKLAIIIPRFPDSFAGNLKYVFLYMSQSDEKEGLEAWYLTKRGDVLTALKSYGLPAVAHPSFKSVFLLLRARVVMVESTKWGGQLKSALSCSSIRYQVWHGNGLKEVSMTNPITVSRMDDPLSNRVHEALDMYPTYDFMCFSSQAQVEARSSSFKFQEVFINGQPRNDVLFGEGFKHSNVGCDVASLSRIKTAADSGMSIVLYSPTWRPSNEVQLSEALDWSRLNDFFKKHNALLVYKGHPKEVFSPCGSENIVVYQKDKDIYPAISFVQVMITDYSSIFMDFILLDRPVIFFPYDEESYIRSRGLQHDYHEVTPGPKCYNQAELEMEINICIVHGADKHKDRRKFVVEKFNQYLDGRSCERLYQHIMRL